LTADEAAQALAVLDIFKRIVAGHHLTGRFRSHLAGITQSLNDVRTGRHSAHASDRLNDARTDFAEA
jgi:hypothetical protein